MKFVVDEDIPYIKSRLEGVGEVEYINQNDFNAQSVKDADVLLIRTRTRCNEALLKGSKVKCIATGTIGMDHIDTQWCRSAGIATCNSPGCNAPGVAQYVWTSLFRAGFDTSRDVLGVVGYGNVGRIVAAWGEALGARVIINDPPLELKRRTPPHIPFTPLPELLQKANYLTLHVPHTFDGEFPTHHLISAQEISMLPREATIINAARGGVLDETAALSRPDLRFIIDTWEGEPSINPEMLKRALIATPHIAGYSKQGKQRATRMILEAVNHEFNLDIPVSDLPAPYEPPVKFGDSFKQDIMDTAQGVWLWPDSYTQRIPLLDDFDSVRSAYRFRDEVELNNE